MTAASPEFQVDFLRKMQNLLADGGFVATYKYALLHAIADLCVESDPEADGTLTLGVNRLAAKFIELYWRQSQVFPIRDGVNDLVLKQNTGRQAAVITELCELQPRYESRLPTLRNDPRTWAKTLRRVGSTIRTMPLWKLQTIGTRPVEFLYRNTGADHIVLLPGVAECFRNFHGLIIELVRAGWVRFIRRHNDEVRESLELYTFLFGSERVSLQDYRKVLIEVEGRDCFYCRRTIRRDAHVDHFVPWARYPNDLGHNFVLADRDCNKKKSDHLAAEEHLERWAERNASRGEALAERLSARGLAHDGEASARIAVWAYSQLETNRGEVWVRDGEFRPLGSGWRGLFSPR